MTIALTRAGIPRSGQMRRRAVAALNKMTKIASTPITQRQRLVT
jgi:hypothetical protein